MTVRLILQVLVLLSGKIGSNLLVCTDMYDTYIRIQIRILGPYNETGTQMSKTIPHSCITNVAYYPGQSCDLPMNLATAAS